MTNSKDYKRNLTVAELIELLADAPQDAEIWLEGDGGYSTAEGIEIVKGKIKSRVAVVINPTY